MISIHWAYYLLIGIPEHVGCSIRLCMLLLFLCGVRRNTLYVAMAPDCNKFPAPNHCLTKVLLDVTSVGLAGLYLLYSYTSSRYDCDTYVDMLLAESGSLAMYFL